MPESGKAVDKEREGHYKPYLEKKGMIDNEQNRLDNI
jgi:hypothetical protein